jgi:Phospholipase_D-nuclease N-terminal
MIGVGFGLFFLLVAFSGFAFWIWMLVDCATNESDLGNTKIVWILVILFANIVGALVYFVVRRPQRAYASMTTHTR